MQIYTSFGAIREHVMSGRVRSTVQVMGVIRDAGLDGMELNTYVVHHPELYAPTMTLNPDEFDWTRITIHSNYVDFNLGSINSYVRQACLTQLRAEAAEANSRGVRTLTFHPGRAKKIPREQAMNLLWGSLEEFFSEWQAPLPRVCLENMDDKPGKLCNTFEEIRATLSRFPQLWLTIDFAHLGLNRADIGAFIDEFGDRIAHVHVSGVRFGVSHSKVPLTESEVDLRPHLARLADRDLVAVIENGDWDTMMASKAVVESVRTGNWRDRAGDR